MNIGFVLAAKAGQGCLSAHTKRSSAKHGAWWHTKPGILLAILLLAWPRTATAQTAPTIALTYHGDIEGLASTVTMQFEDLRLMASGTGFFNFGGRPGWLRQDPLSGRIYVSARIISPTAGYYLSNGQVNGTSDWGYVDIVPDVGSSFLGRLDFPSDIGHVYIDQFSLTPNPLMPPQTTYFFQLDTPTPQPRVTGVTFSAQGAPVIRWEATPGVKYRLVYKNGLSALTWSLAGELTATNSTGTLQDNAAIGTTQRFYRLERQN